MNRLASTCAILALGLLLGFLAARSWPEASQSASPDSSADANPSPAHSVTPWPGTLRARPQATATIDTPARATSDSTRAGGTLPREAETVRIPTKFFSKIQCMVFNTSSNNLTDDIVELLHISPEERERLDSLIATTRARVEEHELDRATLTEQSASRVVLKIAANPDAGRDLEDSFINGVQETLGDRAATFLERAQPYESTMFSNFGRNDTTLTVTRDETSNLLRVQSQQEYTTPGGGHGTVSSTTIAKQMPERWKKFFQTP